MAKVGYPSDGTEKEWAFVLPYLLLCRENSPQREYDLRAGFDAVRWIAETGSPRRWMPNDLPPRVPTNKDALVVTWPRYAVRNGRLW